MSYAVKELYYTLQGEGAQTGRPAVFLRFAGCNLWSGLERDRAGAVCKFCDTDFVGVDGPGGGKFADADALARAVAAAWPGAAGEGRPYVVCTGGEPLLQVDAPLIGALHRTGFEVGVETNGTIAAPEGLDWVCVRPKSTSPLVQRSGNEFFFLQPMDGPSRAAEAAAAIDYCRRRPQWRLSLQTHKLLGIP